MNSSARAQGIYKVQLEVDPLSAAAIDSLLATAYRAPKAIIRRAAALVEPSARSAD